MKPKLILISHGQMAIEALESAKMIVGENSDIIALGMTAEDGGENISAELDKIITNSPDAQLIIAVDLLGGTPGNIATMKMQRYDNISLITGFNLGMILEYATCSINERTSIVDLLIDSGKSGITHIQNKINSCHITSDEIDI